MCQCDCGNIHNVVAHHLRSGSTKSCGCLHFDITAKPKGEAAFNSLYARYRSSAKRHNHIFSLNKIEFKQLISGNCYYCGTRPTQIKNNCGGNGSYIYNGVDRVDNTKDYIITNCVSCCKRCNRAKDVMSQQEFLNWVERVHDHSILRGQGSDRK